METVGMVEMIIFIAVIVLIVMGIRHLIAIGIFKAGSAVADALRDKNDPKYKESEKESLADRFNEHK